MSMSDGNSVTKHLNAFYTIIIQLLSIEIRITKEEKWISLLCSFLDSWDSLVMAIGRNNTTLNLDSVVAVLLLKEMRWKNMDGSNPKQLWVRSQSINRKKDKPSIGSKKVRGKLKLRLTSPTQSMRRCWECGKLGH